MAFVVLRRAKLDAMKGAAMLTRIEIEMSASVMSISQGSSPIDFVKAIRLLYGLKLRFRTVPPVAGRGFGSSRLPRPSRNGLLDLCLPSSLSLRALIGLRDRL